MKTIEVDDELYQYIASQTRHIGESASDILRRMLKISAASQPATPATKDVVSQPRQLYSLDNKAFAEATESLHGRTRVYFAGDEQTLLQNGNQTKPKHVPGTPYWVITNTNTGRKCSMIEHIMQSMQFPAELIEKVCGTI